MKKKHFIIPIFIPDLGCPNQCVFCNQKEITGQRDVPSPGEVKDKVEEYLTTIPKEKASLIEVAFYGGSFTAIPSADQKAFLQAAWEYVRKGLISGIRISTRPDKINEDILGTLMAYGVTTIELGVQSMHPEVLDLARRGHSVEDVIKASQLIRSWGFFLGIQLMIGLPGDSQEKALETCNKIIDLIPRFVRIYPVLVLRKTELEDMFKKGQYAPWSVEDVVETAKVMLNRFERAGIEVIRIGLQNTDEISPGGEIVAGPYHPAIGELVYSALALDQLRTLLRKAGINRGTAAEIEVAVSPKYESKVKGQKSGNVKTLTHEFELAGLKIVKDSKLESGIIKLTQIDGKPASMITSTRDLTL